MVGVTVVATKALGGEPTCLRSPRECGGAGLRTWPLVTPDPTSLVTGLFLFLPGQFRDMGQRMKGLVVSGELFCEWGECLLSEPSPFG